MRGRTNTLPNPYFYFVFVSSFSPQKHTHTHTHTHTHNTHTTHTHTLTLAHKHFLIALNLNACMMSFSPRLVNYYLTYIDVNRGQTTLYIHHHHIHVTSPYIPMENSVQQAFPRYPRRDITYSAFHCVLMTIGLRHYYNSKLAQVNPCIHADIHCT